MLLLLALVTFTPHQQLVSREFYGKGAFQVAQVVENLPATQEKQETRIQLLGPKDPLEQAWQRTQCSHQRVPWTEGLAGPQCRGCPEPWLK